MLVFFHKAKFIRETSPISQQLQAGRSEQSQHPVQSPSHWRCLQWRGACRSQNRQPQGCTCQMEWESGRAPGLTGTSSAWRSELWVLTASMGRGPTPYQCSYEGLIPVSRLVVLAVPVPRITSVDIALVITGMADSDSMLDCQQCSKSPLGSCPKMWELVFFF